MFHEKDLIGVLLLCLSSCMLLGCGNSQETVSVEFHGYSFEIPADWEDTVPFGVFYSPTPTKLVKKFVDILSSIAAN